MKPRVFIDGDQGTTGLQMRARLQQRSDLRLLSLPPEQRKDPTARADAINHCDLAVLCLPDAAAREAVAALDNPAVRVIDASSAHRVQPGWVYGLAELTPPQARAIAQARRVSNPGCYPTGAVLLLRPLVDAGLLPRDYPLVIHATSGYSGRGRAGLEQHEGTAVAAASALSVYALDLEHKHVPEIQAHTGLTRRPLFVPAYGAFRQGIVLTIALHDDLLAAGASGPRLHECLAAHYAGTRHVQVHAPATAPEALDPQALNGSDGIGLRVLHNAKRGQTLLAAVFDNLGKGAAGAAVQNLDLMLGGAGRH